MNAQTTSGPSRRSLEAIVLLGLLAIVVVLVVYFATRPASPSRTSTNGATNTRLATPRSFTSFVGTVKALEGQTAVVTFHGSNDAGQATASEYRVTVAASTTLSRIGSPAALSFTDLKSGQTVIVAADHNIAAEPSFTATSLQLYQP